MCLFVKLNDYRIYNVTGCYINTRANRFEYWIVNRVDIGAMCQHRQMLLAYIGKEMIHTEEQLRNWIGVVEARHYGPNRKGETPEHSG